VPHGNANTDSDSHRYADSFTNGNSYCHSYGYTDCDSYVYAYSYSYTDCDSYIYAYSYSYTHGDSDRYGYSDSNGHSHADGYIYAYRHGNRHCHRDRNSDRFAAKYAYAAASSDTGAPLRWSCKLRELARTNSRAPGSIVFKKLDPGTAHRLQTGRSTFSGFLK
jgi:hypothetical protein